MYAINIYGLVYDKVCFYAESDEELIEIINFLSKYGFEAYVKRLEDE